MIGPEEKDQEVTFKVADRRKFNPDGSLKEGVQLEETKPSPDPPVGRESSSTETTSTLVESVPQSTTAAPAAAAPDPDTEFALEEDAGDEIPGADDPASFVNFLSTLATNAAASLGAVPHPATGQRSLDLDTGKYWLDVLGMLKDKTKGNLHPQESRLLEGLLADLRMQYVTMVRATEEKLKQQAAKKFSGADILGKKL